MLRVRLTAVNDFAEWQAMARGLLLAAVAPGRVAWSDPSVPDTLFATSEPPSIAPVTGRKVGRVPPRFLKLGAAAICHNDPDRFGHLYSLLFRLQKDRTALFNLEDRDIAKLNRRVEHVVAEYTRMKTELRFRRAVSADGHKGLAASFQPKHYVLERVAPHFAQTMRGEDWIIMTPYRTAFWDGKELSYGPGRS